MQKIGNLVKVQTKNNGNIIGVVVERHFSNFGTERVIQPSTPGRRVICSPVDMEVLNENRNTRKK